MKIAMIGQKGLPAINGGIERHVEEISKRMVALGHDVTVYCRKYYNSEAKGFYKGIKLRYLPTIKSKNLDAITHTMVSSIDCIFRDYDIVHYHAAGPATLSFIPGCFGKKVIVTIHGLDWMRSKWGALAKAYLKMGEKAAVCFADNTIAVSNTLKEYYMNVYRKNIVYIPNGTFMPNLLEPQEIKKFGLERDGYILFLARLTPEKGCHYLIDAYKRLKTDKKLVIAGSSNMIDIYEDTLIKNFSSDIIFTGNVTGRLLNELYSNAYVYVLPSEVEGHPISLLEAMSYKKCCLVSNIPENIEILKDDSGKEYGFYFENKDVGDLTEVLKFLLSNSKMVKRIGEEAGNMVLEKFNWDRIVKETLNVYLKSV